MITPIRGEKIFVSNYVYMGIKSCVLKSVTQEKNRFWKRPTLAWFMGKKLPKNGRKPKIYLRGWFPKNSGDADKLLEWSMIVFLVNLYTNGKKKTIGSHHRVKTMVWEFFGKASIFFRKIKMEQKVLTEDPKSSNSDFL